MSKKGNASDLIMEIIKLIFMITFIYLAFSWGVLTNENGSINYSGLLFILVPSFFIGKSAYNFYRNFKYREK